MVGTQNVTRMPPRILTALVALLILIAAIWALTLSDPAENAIVTLGGGILALVFLGRGVAGFTPKWRALTPEEPFATFDKKVYSPLCLMIGIGFAFLTYWRF